MLKKSKEAVGQLTEKCKVAEYDKFKTEEKLVQMKSNYEERLMEVSTGIHSLNEQLHQQKEFNEVQLQKKK